MKTSAAMLFCFLTISFQSCEKSSPTTSSASASKIIYQRTTLAHSEKVEIQKRQLDYEFSKNGSRMVGMRSDYTNTLQNVSSSISLSEFWKLQNSYEVDEIDSDDSFSIEIVDSDDQHKKVFVEGGAQFPSSILNIKQKLDSLTDALML